MRNLHLGLIMECEYRTGASQDDAFAEAFALSRTAEEGGIDEVWLAERHFASPALGGGDRVPSFASAPLIMASAIAARTSRLRIGIAVTVVPLVHPVRLAEEVATLDQISRGRFDLGVGRSISADAYYRYGLPYEESRERFQECLEILKLAWTQESFSYAGKFYTFDDVCVVPKPVQRPHPPIRVAATSAATYPIAGTLGYPIFLGLRGADLGEVAQWLQSYRAAWHEAGHAGDGDVILRIPLYVAESTEQAYEEPRESTLRSYRRYIERYAETASARGAEQPVAAGLAESGYDDLLQSRMAYGTPDAVTERLASLRDEMGLSGFVVEPNVGGGIPRDQVFKSVRLFAEKVVPNLR